MKRKIFSILFALVLVLTMSLVAAVPVAAGLPLQVIPFELDTSASAGEHSATSEWDDVLKPAHGSLSVNLNSGASGIGAEAKIVIDASDVGVTDLDSLNTISWYRYSVSGYAPHVDVIVEVDGGTDALVFEYAYNTEEGGVRPEGQPTYGTVYNFWHMTFGDDGEGPAVIRDTAYAWLSSGPAGGEGIIGGTLAEWKAGTVNPSVNGTSTVLRFEIEVDNWMVASQAYIDSVAINYVTYYGSIQDAIDAASPNDTINVAAGTYDEDVTITTSLQLLGAKVGVPAGPDASPANRDLPSEESIIDGRIIITGTGKTLIDGFTILNEGQHVIDLDGGGDVIKNNIIDGISVTAVKSGIFSRGNGGYLITNNNIRNCGRFGITFDGGEPAPQCTISGNYITNITGRDDTAGIQTMGSWSNGHIFSNNLIENCGAGIVLAQGEHQVSGNTIRNNSGSGILLWAEPGKATRTFGIQITHNTIEGNVTGIKLWPDDPSAVDNVAHFNNIVGNDYGVVNEHSAVFDATNNYWGHASGPKHNPGYGDPVSGKVLFNPWLLGPAPGATPFDKTLALNIGWTLISTDNWVDTAETSWEGVTLALKYTAGIGYETATVLNLEPVSALYLKTVGGGGIAITYSGGVPVASSKDLEAGWNLISSATETYANAVLSPLRFVQVGDEQGIGLTTVVSQGNYNLHTVSFYLPTLTDADWDGRITNGDGRDLGGVMLNPFDGYWVYMNAAKTFGVVPY